MAAIRLEIDRRFVKIAILKMLIYELENVGY